MEQGETLETRIFRHQRLEYLHKWIPQRHTESKIAASFGQKLLDYYNMVTSRLYPDGLFNQTDGLRCSSFRIKGLYTDARKKIAMDLWKRGLLHMVVNGQPCPDFISPEIAKLPKMANVWFEIFSATSEKNPGHDPVLDKILKMNPNALAIEVPIWTTTREKLASQEIKRNSFTCMSNESFTGHIDLLLFDETDGSLVVADYKPENYLMRSLPQVATYGLVMKQLLGLEEVKCVSFSKEKAWVYDPEIIRTQIPRYLKQYGDPSLPWLPIVPSL